MVSLVTSEPPDYEGPGVLRMPPHANEAEQALLGGILHNPRAYDVVFDLVTEHDFYRASHRALWRLISERIDAGKQVDPITILDLADDETRDLIPLLLNNVPSVVNVRQYATLIRGKSHLRQMIAAGTEMAERAFALGADPQELLERAEAAVLRIADGSASQDDREPVTIYQAVSEAIDFMDSDRTSGISTGYSRLDAMLSGGGLQPEQLVIIAGRPAMGKSALSYCIAEHAAVNGKSVAYFALETSRREIGVRAVRWHEQKLGRRDALKFFADLPITIDDTPAITLSHIRVRCRRIKRLKGLDLIVVDYLQLMKCRAQSRLEEVSEISRGLKAIAKEFGVPAVALCQLNRSVESRPDKRPQMGDLRESGQIEQDADTVLMCYRDEYYNADTHLQGYGEILVRKNRDGPQGDALLRWDGPHTRWIEYLGERPTPPQQPVLAGDSGTVKAFKPRST